MRFKILPLLVCPSCGGGLALGAEHNWEEAGRIKEGSLRCLSYEASYAIVKYIPRFVPAARTHKQECGTRYTV